MREMGSSSGSLKSSHIQAYAHGFSPLGSPNKLVMMIEPACHCCIHLLYPFYFVEVGDVDREPETVLGESSKVCITCSSVVNFFGALKGTLSA